jgi:hypothetical protein
VKNFKVNQTLLSLRGSTDPDEPPADDARGINGYHWKSKKPIFFFLTKPLQNLFLGVVTIPTYLNKDF